MAKKTTKKKTNQSVKRVAVNEENEIIRLIKLVVIVTLIFLAFYLLTILINKEEEKETQKASASIQYDKILAGNILEKTDPIYYVLCYDTEDYNSIVYEAYANVYENSLLGSKVYTVELNNPFNKKYVGEESNLDVKDVTDLKFKGVTLLKIENNKIVEYFEGEEVVTKLSKLVEEVNEIITEKK